MEKRQLKTESGTAFEPIITTDSTVQAGSSNPVQGGGVATYVTNTIENLSLVTAAYVNGLFS